MIYDGRSAKTSGGLLWRNSNEFSFLIHVAGNRVACEDEEARMFPPTKAKKHAETRSFHALALYTFHYNFSKIHKTPALHTSDGSGCNRETLGAVGIVNLILLTGYA